MTHEGSQTHCVFRRGSTLFAFPTYSVREVMERPAMAQVPHTKYLLAGLCHVRNRFIPVLRLDELLVESTGSLPEEQKMLVMDDPEGAWGVLADDVHSLASLEVSAAAEAAPDDKWSDSIVGLAAYETQVVRILHPERLREVAEQDLLTVISMSGIQNSEELTTC